MKKITPAKISIFIITLCILIGVWFVYTEIYTAKSQKVDQITFQINLGESVSDLADRLESEYVIRNAWLFKKYIFFKGIDREIRQGNFQVNSPITLAHVVKSLANPSVSEQTITILPGWNLRDIAKYFESQGIIANADELYAVVGKPAYNYKVLADHAPAIEADLPVLRDKPDYVSYEGYIAPDTYRVFKDASVSDIVQKLIKERDGQFTDEMYSEITKSNRTVFEVLTVASIVEREVQYKADKAKVADIFWRRYDLNWALQADSTVHYVVGTDGDVFTTKDDRESLSPWNTYKYPGLPFGPISSPSLATIQAVIHPEINNDWYFLTDSEGNVHYAETLEGHNLNVGRYLR
ncbi:MAG: endolytic transglycosylase MltG [Candidatus Magasanikbacteria bacterium CG_4_10_14_0_2_um_filter_37_12]|uniref:Endolytic murein transglycosylase n=1 Tax=Candidatus Magasanikbacteria bacterium CG_4_10_14_0_2_um_filter_37_12 TaxID=1974637 RepID=A0A2M7V7J9_9BACT|nr:MAG: endolytic transglycosylase MltG [Candidatus Magasanikbacteria bacterium CG_4_10_14_0_2_um_filter_37_12]